MLFGTRERGSKGAPSDLRCCTDGYSDLMDRPISEREGAKRCPECGTSANCVPRTFTRPWRLASWALLIVGVASAVLLLFWHDPYGAGSSRGKYFGAQQWVWPETTLSQLREIAAGTRPAPTDLSRFERVLGSGGWGPSAFPDEAVLEIFLTSRQPILRWKQFSLGWPLRVYASSTAFSALNSDPKFRARDSAHGSESFARGIATWYEHGAYCQLNTRAVIWALFAGLLCAWLVYFAWLVLRPKGATRRLGWWMMLVGLGSALATLLVPNRTTHDSIAFGVNTGVQATPAAPTGITLGEIRSLATQPSGESKFAERLVAAIDAIPRQPGEAKPRAVEGGDHPNASEHDEKQIPIIRLRYEDPSVIAGREFRGWWFASPWLYTSSAAPVASREGPRLYWWTEFGSLWFNLIAKEPGTARTIAVSIEAMCLVAAIAFGPALFLVSLRSAGHKYVCQRRAARGHCIRCGYDMQGTPAGSP